MNCFYSDRRQNSFYLHKKLHFYRSLSILNKLHADSIGNIIPRFLTIFGFIWMMGVVGVLRLSNVVKTVDYLCLWCLSVGGTISLLGTVHFTGNIPKECRILLEYLNFSYEPNVSPIQRKLLRKDVLSLRLFGLRSGPIRLLKHNAVYLYFGGLVNFIITFLVAHPDLGKT
jgi:predicted membrane channel-forming protein YqfA (hemolysin III family)